MFILNMGINNNDIEINDKNKIKLNISNFPNNISNGNNTSIKNSNKMFMMEKINGKENYKIDGNLKWNVNNKLIFYFNK